MVTKAINNILKPWYILGVQDHVPVALHVHDLVAITPTSTLSFSKPCVGNVSHQTPAIEWVLPSHIVDQP